VKSSPKNRARPALKLVNLELDMPTVPLALSRLGDALRTARQEGYAGVKIIHGYGSSGEGGAIRGAVQAELMQRVRAGEIRGFITGEDWRISDERSWALLHSRPELKQDSDLGRGNKGISIVVL
jgi:Smr domain